MKYTEAMKLKYLYQCSNCRVKCIDPAGPSGTTKPTEVNLQLRVSYKTWVPKHGWEEI